VERRKLQEIARQNSCHFKKILGGIMNSLEIEAFLAILQHGNLTEAAKDLFISQSTLSHRLSELEKEVGVRLIDRKRGGNTLVLTDCGKEFLATAKRWEGLVQETERLKYKTKAVKLSIGTVDTFHAFVFPPLYKVLSEHMPKISINLRTYNSTELYSLIDRGELDVAFTLLNLPMSNIVVKQVYKEPRVVLRKGITSDLVDEFIDLGDLDPEKEIFFIGDTAFHTWYQKWKEQRGYPSLQVDTTQLLSFFMSQDGAWSVVPLCIARKMLQIDSCSYYSLKDSPPERVCYRIQSQYPTPSSLEGIDILDSYLNLVFDKL
jgi:DNA-binding transcriptional LysR family regulator